MADKRPWWGEYHFETDSTRSWQLAGLDLRITRHTAEWHLESYRHPDQHEDLHDWQEQLGSIPLAETARLHRHLFTSTSDSLHLLPRLADRPVVIKPIDPLYIPAGQHATLFVSTPLWLSVWAGHHPEPLLDLPVVRPSDTWFGITPVRGQVCYATKVFCRTELSQLPIRPFRAVTPVSIDNAGPDTMPIERLCMPMPLLELYSATDGRLWTPGLRVERQPNTRIPRVRVDNHLHPAAGNVKRLGSARHADEDTLGRMFEHFLTD